MFLTKLKFIKSGFLPKTGISLFLATMLLTGCLGGPERIPQDISVDKFKESIQPRIRASKVDDNDRANVRPRRKLIQIRHNPKRLNDFAFREKVQNLVMAHSGSDAPSKMPLTTMGMQPEQSLDPDQTAQILHNRAIQRNALLSRAGLQLEEQMYPLIENLRERLQEAEASLLGLTPGATPPEVFGRNLTRDADGFLQFPADMVFVGSADMPVTSSTFARRLKQSGNITLFFQADTMALPEALQFIADSANMQISLTDSLSNRPEKLTLRTQAPVYSIFEAIISQYGLGVAYDPRNGILQLYDGEEFATKLQRERAAISAFNANLFQSRKTSQLAKDLTRLENMIALGRVLMDGDDVAFFEAVQSMDRNPTTVEIQSALATVTNLSLSIRDTMMRFDQGTEAALSTKSKSQTVSNFTPSQEFAKYLVADACLEQDQIVLTEYISVYQVPVAGVTAKLGTYFNGRSGISNAVETSATLPLQTGDGTASGAVETATDDSTASQITTALQGTTAQAETSTGCESSGNQAPILVDDETGFLATASLADMELLVSLVESFDVPTDQVLVEVFMLKVSKNFSRNIDSFLNGSGTTDVGGVASEGFIRRDAGKLTDAISNRNSSGYALGVMSLNNNVEALIEFLETNNLGRSLSSPTLIVGSQKEAEIRRTLKVSAVVPVPVYNADQNGQASTEVKEYTAEFLLNVSEVAINPLNNNVSLKFHLKDESFTEQVNLPPRVNSDEIKTDFSAAPGDVIVLAGLYTQNDVTNASGLPGTTTLNTQVPVASLLGGSDKLSLGTEEMIILMVPSIISADSGKKAPHLAFSE